MLERPKGKAGAGPAVKREKEEGGAADAATGPSSSQQQGRLASVSPLVKKPRGGGGAGGAAKRKREVASEAPATAVTAVHTLDPAVGYVATGSGSAAGALVGGTAKPTAKRRREATPAPTASVAVDPSLPSADQKDSVLQSLPGLHNVGMPDTAAAAATTGPLKGDQKPGAVKRPRKKPAVAAAAEAGGAAVPVGSTAAVTAVAEGVTAGAAAAGAIKAAPKQLPVEKKYQYPSAEEDRLQVEQCVAVGVVGGGRLLVEPCVAVAGRGTRG